MLMVAGKEARIKEEMEGEEKGREERDERGGVREGGIVRLSRGKE